MPIASIIQRLLFPVASGAMLMAVCSGCSFDREWNQRYPAAKAGDISGRWQGTWTSGGDGHSGKLRCVITQPADETYRAHFDATFAAIFHFGYVATLQGKQTGGGVIHLTGEQDLGWIAGGIYRYDGETDGSAFHCTYESKADHGVFEMKKLE